MSAHTAEPFWPVVDVPPRIVQRLRLVAALVVLTWSALGLLVLRAYYTGRNDRRFLVWNLFLATLPFVFALIVDMLPRRRWAVVPGAFAGLLWLSFFPNAPYLITDLMHLERESDVPFWFDAVVFAVFAFAGTLIGLASLVLVHARVRELFGWTVGWAFAVVSLGLCGVGIYVGRFLRWNTWDIWHEPGKLASEFIYRVRHPLENPRLIVVSVLFAGFMTVAYVAVREVGATAADAKYRSRRPRCDERDTAARDVA